MRCFNERTIEFLNELRLNNNRVWFLENKNRFKKEVEIPFNTFTTDLIIELKPYIPNSNVVAKDCIFRIYRDVRFGMDKTPCKNHVSAMISPGGRKNKTTPGIYVEISGQAMRVLSGCYVLSTGEIEKVRGHIFNNLEKFDSLIKAPGFASTFGHIRGKSRAVFPAYIVML
ncbi:DUF2461 domain-containing protein [Flagellimonas lutimaris]|uniref:DUF2461 domain-containing protein n=1 Tax=Flagellimonas lutimaris TaxID=475082 RepID=A0A3A1NDE0_9FLAO|nr:DUF2461 domain-containing protein [Allomuricauda lutimaris]RIV36686.1 DUF2461 domain-containing protein [Allomuricauda lutimaris]